MGLIVATNYNPVSLENLLRAGKFGKNYAGQNRIIAALVKHLRDEGITDEEVRYQLGKIDEFEVSDAARIEVLERKARKIYGAIFSTITKKLAKREVVSISGFARFENVGNGDAVLVAKTDGGRGWTVINKNDQIYMERRTASVPLNLWEGGAVRDRVDANALAEGVTHYYDANTARSYPWDVDMWVSGAFMNLVTGVDITATSKFGYQRNWQVGGLAIMIYVRRYRRPSGSGDQDLVYSAYPGQGARLWAAIKAAFPNVPDKELRAGMGRTYAASIDDYAMMAARGLDYLSEEAVASEDVVGVTARAAVAGWPRSVRMVAKSNGGNLTHYEVGEVSVEEFVATWGWDEARLRADGSWPERSRNFRRGVRATFRPAFVAGVLSSQ